MIFLRSWDEPKVNTKPKIIIKVVPKVFLFFHIRCHQSFIQIFITAKKIQLKGTHVVFLFHNRLSAWRMDALCVGINGSPKAHDSNLKLEKRCVICCVWDMLMSGKLFNPHTPCHKEIRPCKCGQPLSRLPSHGRVLPAKCHCTWVLPFQHLQSCHSSPELLVFCVEFALCRSARVVDGSPEVGAVPKVVGEAGQALQHREHHDQAPHHPGQCHHHVPHPLEFHFTAANLSIPCWLCRLCSERGASPNWRVALCNPSLDHSLDGAEWLLKPCKATHSGVTRLPTMLHCWRNPSSYSVHSLQFLEYVSSLSLYVTVKPRESAKSKRVGQHTWYKGTLLGPWYPRAL